MFSKWDSLLSWKLKNTVMVSHRQVPNFNVGDHGIVASAYLCLDKNPISGSTNMLVRLTIKRPSKWIIKSYVIKIKLTSLLMSHIFSIHVAPNYLKHGLEKKKLPFALYFYLCRFLTNNWYIQKIWWRDLNHGSPVTEATTLPAELNLWGA